MEADFPREVYTTCSGCHNCLRAERKSQLRYWAPKFSMLILYYLLPWCHAVAYKVHGSFFEDCFILTSSKVERGKKVHLINFGPQFHKLKHFESKYLFKVKGQSTKQKMQQRMYFMHLKQLHKEHYGNSKYCIRGEKKISLLETLRLKCKL